MRNATIISVLLLLTIWTVLNSQYTYMDLNLPGTYGSMVSFGDYNQDEDLDMVLSGSVEMSGLGQTYLFDNQGNFNFTAVNPPFMDVFHSFVDWTDYNNDGYLDAIVCGVPYLNANPVTKVYKGLMNGQFIEIPQTFVGADNASAEWGDY